MTTRKTNFNAGPATLPAEVLEQAAGSVLEYGNTGLSILEIPHRGKEFYAILEESKSLVRELCQLNEDYEVLWIQGGGRQLFCMIPMNFLPADGKAGYIDSGHWASEAMKYAGYYGGAIAIATGKENNYTTLPQIPKEIESDYAYIHLTTNNTIYGTQWRDIPTFQNPLIADMSSDIFSCQRDFTQFAMFYAAAQKNLGVAGIGLAAVNKNMLQHQAREVPPFLDFIEQVKENSIVNTANVFGVYASLLMLRWIKKRGLANLENENIQKSNLLYNAIDKSSVFKAVVQEKTHRSRQNICFTSLDSEQETLFKNLCKESSITGIAGHRSVGGYRVSIYNAVTLESVKILVEIIEHLG